MSVPSFRNSRSKVRRRRLHHKLTTVQVVDCAKCGAKIQPHHACGSCGNYNNRQVIQKAEVLEKAAPKAAKETKKKEVKEKKTEEKAK